MKLKFGNWSLPDDQSLQVLSPKRLQSLEYVSLNCENKCSLTVVRIGALDNLVGKHPSIRRLTLKLAVNLDADKAADIAKTLVKFVEVDLIVASKKTERTQRKQQQRL